MDIRGCVFVVLLIVNCLFVTYTTAAQIPHDEMAAGYPIDEVSTELKLSYLEKKLKEDIERELHDVMAMENQLHHNMKMVQEKKRQLEIKKRTPVRCLVNVIACWKK